MRIGVIQFPGTNCERETMEAIRRAGMEPLSHRWNMDQSLLRTYDGYVIAGGFSYEDRSRSGIIAAQDPIMETIKIESEKGKPVLGICNGAQILVESGLVPGIEGYRQGAALTTNRRIENDEVLGTGFYNAWVNIKFDGAPEQCAFTSALEPGELLKIPAAHAEGRFILPEALLEEMKSKKMTLFRYADDNGECDPDFPVNPNGSVHNLAAVCNAAGTVMAMMPHPERTAAGDKIFISMRQYLERHRDRSIHIRPELPLKYYIAPGPSEPYTVPQHAAELLIGLIITDNEAVSVESTLRQKGIKTGIRRYTHWEIRFDENASEALRAETYRRIIQSGELFNSNKEYIIDSRSQKNGSFSRSYLIRERDDCVGEHAFHALTGWFGISHISSIHHGTVWTIIPDNREEADELYTLIEKTHLLGNPIAHRSMIYDK